MTPPAFFAAPVHDNSHPGWNDTVREAARYLDLKLQAAGPEALARQPAMDGARSKFNTPTSEIPGRGNQTYISPMFSFAVRAELMPVADLFWTEEKPTMHLAVDALAAWVMRVRGTGICFQDPETIGTLNGPIRLRTARGIQVKHLG